MLSVHAGIYFLEKHSKSYRIPFLHLVVRCIKHLGGDIYLKQISKASSAYNWKAIRKIHNTNGFNVVVQLRNPDEITQIKDVYFEDFSFNRVRKNQYDGWHISGVYVYSDDQGFVGSIEDALQLYNKNIVPFRTSPDNPYCQIGYCEKEEVWYAWHNFHFQNMKSFAIGTSTSYGQDTFVPANHLDLVRHFQALTSSYDRMLAWVDEDDSNTLVQHVVIRAYRDKHSQEYEQRRFLFPRSWGHGSWTAISLEDARVMAAEFAEHSPYVFFKEEIHE